ncbi:MAG: PDZ domain-containing protein [Oscillospiraceae bacterium]|jgi:carboxyl-terminal processing protease|nr:PDZ domain-containing protein [Oscillospiraceae bacterium]
MNKKYSLKMMITLMLIASALTCLIIAVILDSQLGFFSKRFNAVREYAALLSRIEDLYIGEYDGADVSAAANGAAVYALGDRWSFYMTPDEYVGYLDSSNNRFAGIGISAVVDEETGGMRVHSVYSGSAAETSGILAGDVITGIDGSDIAGLDLDEMRALLARSIGDAINLTILHEDGGVESITVVYSMVFTDPVEYEMLEDNIGYIVLVNFETGAAGSFIAAVKQLVSEGATGCIFDVRGNGGGRVSELTAMLDYLLPEGEIFVAVDKSGREEITMSDPGSVDLPCVVLVDRYSYSAAEYFAATLGEYGYADIIGEQTTGKNRSQITVTLPGGGALHISSGQYLTKNRVSLYDTGGLTPDYQIALTDEEISLLFSGNLEKEADVQFKKAVEVLLDKIK